MLEKTALLALLIGATACGGSAKQAPAPPPPPAAKSTAPAGPTRTDFQTIAGKLVKRCVAGGWISRWRSEQPDVDVARPRIYLRDFDDQTGQDLDPSYLTVRLEGQMRKSGVFEMTTENGEYDFIGRGKLLRLAERRGGQRVSVYTAILELLNPETEKVAYSCEATVEGEM